ncbi:predicted protein [Nematostella vectensis]|uniref:FAD dependent oxidoreductase domain-containing protein n=1 Tax=Nematostella vectensis TaxID=45351 RepID=A7S323_NEMVE|nr:D-aspartate oxidase [Nematostella vectensis]EDO41884.1 predicted protein [Nematostella vectensis]|eukprot:XP_001633947.1 predicted protein [Nematostella vectensis]
MAASARSVAVVGCGCIGITAALSILERDPCVRVTIISDSFSPDNTTDGAAGILLPFVLWDTPESLQRKWFGETIDRFHQLLQTEMAPELGIFKISGCFYFDTPKEEPFWKDQVFGFRRLRQEELKACPWPVKDGFAFSTIFSQAAYYMPWMMKRAKDLGAVFIQKKVKSLQELSGSYDVVVNCTGMRAKELVHDELLRPIRGQVLRVQTPNIKEFCLYVNQEWEKYGRVAYILPQMNDVVVIGGTDQLDNYNTSPTLKDTVNIIEGVSKFVPSLKNANIIKNWAGLRPARKSVRLEKEIMTFRDGSGQERKLNVVHNYGHGGSGLSLCFGCAKDCCDLVFEFLAARDKGVHARTSYNRAKL